MVPNDSPMPGWVRLGLVLSDGSADYSITSYTTKSIGLKSLTPESFLTVSIQDLYQWFKSKEFFECDDCRRRLELCEDCRARRVEFDKTQSCRLPALCREAPLEGYVERPHATRAETGPMAFGSDWPGVFIRGDNALAYALSLRELINVDLGDDLCISRKVLEGLLTTLESASTQSPSMETLQRMVSFAEAHERSRLPK